MKPEKILKTYSCWGKVVGSKYLGEVQAETAAEAYELAMKLNSHISLCHQCAHEVDDLEVEEMFVDLQD